MNEVELYCKVVRKKKKSEEDLALEKTRSIIDGDYEIVEEEKIYDYEPMIVDLDLVADCMRAGPNHVQVVMKYGNIYIFRISYSDYKQLYQELTRRTVITIKTANVNI